jgi:hypothetical protein
MTILYFTFWCRPFYDYWSVPVTNPQCATAENHLLLNFVLNVSSDLMIMAIPLPLLIRTKLPSRKKLALVAAFSLGLFVIASAVLNKYHSFTNPQGSYWVYWFARESSAAVIVANIPHLWSLSRQVFKLSSFVGSTPGGSHLAPVPTRFYQDIENPLSPRRPLQKSVDGSSSSSVDTYDIDRVLADAERAYTPSIQPSRFRDMTDKASERKGPKKSRVKLPASPLPAYMLKAPTPLSPISLKFDN